MWPLLIRLLGSSSELRGLTSAFGKEGIGDLVKSFGKDFKASDLFGAAEKPTQHVKTRSSAGAAANLASIFMQSPAHQGMGKSIPTQTVGQTSPATPVPPRKSSVPNMSPLAGYPLQKPVQSTATITSPVLPPPTPPQNSPAQQKQNSRNQRDFDKFMKNMGKSIVKVTGIVKAIFPVLAKSLSLHVALVSFFPSLFLGMKAFAGLIVESNRDLERWNGTLAASFANLDILKQNLEIRQGKETEFTASVLNEEFGKLLQEFQPISSALSNLTNTGALIATEISRILLRIGENSIYGKFASAGYDWFKKWLGIPEPVPDANDPLADLLRTVGNRKNQQPAGNKNVPDPLPPPTGPRPPLPPIILPPLKLRGW